MISFILFIIKVHLGIDKVCLHWPFFQALAVFSCPSKQMLELFFPFANISLKSNLNATAIGYLLRHYSIVDQKWISSLHEKKDMVNRERCLAEPQR
jgi:hypothetical protein